MGAYSPAESARFLLTFSLGAGTAPRPPVVHPFARRMRTSAFSMVANHTTKHHKLTANTTNKEQNQLKNII